MRPSGDTRRTIYDQQEKKKHKRAFACDDERGEQQPPSHRVQTAGQRFTFDIQSKERWRLNVKSEGKKKRMRKKKKIWKKKRKENKPKWIGWLWGNETSRSSPFRAGHQLIRGANQSTPCLLESSPKGKRWLQSNRIEIDSSESGKKMKRKTKPTTQKLELSRLRAGVLITIAFVSEFFLIKQDG